MEIRIDKRVIEDMSVFDVLGSIPAISVSLLKVAIEDIADQIEMEAQRKAPYGSKAGEGTGELQENPTKREDTFVGVPTLAAPSFGGGFSVRGAGGRFVKGNVSPDTMIVRIPITVSDEPHYAKFVHDGTGIFGPMKRPYTAKPGNKFMRYHAYGVNWKIVSVKGQEPQPYIHEAVKEVQKSYIPLRLTLLSQEIDAFT
jgi:hypothetical protein